MNKLSIMMMEMLFALSANAQNYNVGTSFTTNDSFGYQTTTHKDQYGQITGSSISSNLSLTSSIQSGSFFMA